ncbi:hypothetical protein [Thalassobellus suaedae]|uniref:Cthe-2314-like HEPN domain-containing protein n=1 Tax=Thalassobellus suaedae TaxID=3074124 RepID=A0ABY9Y7K3_9FLAO|nr:hypothetical protein RHP49_07240 [Flavobacteriaceae bacterium HL-DH10]
MNRDYTKTKFSFQSFRSLKKGLGEFDAVVECNELAIREFTSNLSKTLDKESYIQALAEKHSVKVDTVSIKLFESRIRQFYIMSVMQKAEQFFDEFKKEYKSYIPEWTDKKDGETDFDNLLINTFGSLKNGIREIEEEVYFGYEYYRFVRNRFAHSEEKDNKKLKLYLQKVKTYKLFYNITFHSNREPNEYKEIDFNDFLLITNIIKNIGYTLCEKCKPNNQILAEIISKKEITTKSNKKINQVKSLSKLKNNSHRYSNAIGNLLNSNFGRINETDRNEIIINLNRILA